MNSLKIYLGDLTYNTIALSTESFPLNVGYIAAYCLNRFREKVDIKLFKYIEELDKAINDFPPPILGLSNYCWNQRVGVEMFTMLKELNPNALTVWGGPNFPLDIHSQEQFLQNHPQVDVYVPIDGETGFSKVIEHALKVNSVKDIRNKVLSKPIEGCISRGLDGKLQYNSPIRIQNLDDIPSPYLTGLMDKFFEDGRLCPMIQTNRGCPFSCSFCVDGTDYVKQVNRFSIKRVNSEIQYISKKVAKHIHTLYISDLNFGMLPRDLEICQTISEIQQKYDYPHFISCNTGKNAKNRIINAIKNLNGSLQLMMAVQSTDQRVLRNIKRDNISVEQMIELSPAIKDGGLSTKSEVILGLPEETYESHLKTLQDMIMARMDEILVFTLMMLPGSELNTPQERKKWNFKTKFRILPRDFVKLSNGKIVVEIEEVVVGSNTLSFDEYLELRLLNFIIFMTNKEVVYEPIIRFLREQNLDVFEWYYRMLKQEEKAPPIIRSIFNKFRKDTVNELWDSPEEIMENFQQENEYQKLLNGETGINILYFYQAFVISQYMENWTEYALSQAKELLEEKLHFNAELKRQFNDISNYCRGLSFNTLGEDRLVTNPEFVFNYDVKRWIEQQQEADKRGEMAFSLDKFKFEGRSKLTFQITDKQYKLVQDNLDIYGKSFVGMGQVLTRIHARDLWRSQKILQK